ncbi:tripartite tricarboxylate transporter TctB family protein [Actinomadura sp. LOL_016]|uniref:tripartite tricarboxylate transporter TctB family protein n=1 Tax=unclassified Actinomadura TaxID=2626254 RepID=UPI003A808E1C
MRNLYRIGPAIPFLLGVGGVVGSSRMGLGTLSRPGPGLWPLAVSAVLAVVAGALLSAGAPRGEREQGTTVLPVLLGIAGVTGFILVFTRTGLLLPAFLLLLFWLRWLAHERWRLVLPVALAGAVVTQFLFGRVLGVPFPDDLLIGALGTGAVDG